MKMNGQELADLIIHSFLRGVDYEESLGSQKEDLSDVEGALDEYYLFRPINDKDGDWDYNDETGFIR